MNVLPTTAGPGVAEQAEALADMACELHDAASTSASWSAAAVENAVEAMETTVLALAVAHPDAATAMLAIGAAVGPAPCPPRPAAERALSRRMRGS